MRCELRGCLGVHHIFLSIRIENEDSKKTANSQSLFTGTDIMKLSALLLSTLIALTTATTAQAAPFLFNRSFNNVVQHKIGSHRQHQHRQQYRYRPQSSSNYRRVRYNRRHAVPTHRQHSNRYYRGRH